jgi:NitT/TauT family transport system permease protein
MYRELYVADMWAYIAIVVVSSIAVNSALGLAERAIRRDML